MTSSSWVIDQNIILTVLIHNFRLYPLKENYGTLFTRCTHDGINIRFLFAVQEDNDEDKNTSHSGAAKENPCYILIVMEHVKEGSLIEYLGEHARDLTPNDMLQFAHQICLGMQHLAKHKVREYCNKHSQARNLSSKRNYSWFLNIINGSQLAKMKKYIPHMSLPWNV